jgi:UDP-N-acetylmuramate--alanine ligase
VTDASTTHRCHLVGVAGVGMNALAQALRAAGWRVTGSDRYVDTGLDLDVVRKLRRAGVEVFSQDGSGVSSATEAVVVSTAIEAGNPDLAAADRHGVPVRHRAEMLAQLLVGKRTVVVTGTSGKTTVTGMLGWILEQLGADPTVVNGGAVLNWVAPDRVGNVRAGKSDLWVIEADESDRSLLRFKPDWAVITNMSADHFDLNETRALFEQFRSQVRDASIAGWDAGMPWLTFKPELAADGSRFVYQGVRFHVPLLGRHNAENAMQAAVLCERMGYDRARVAVAIESFRGIQRRLERVGAARGVTVLDDYAHNPAKIAAAWNAVVPCYRRVVGVWRPHGFKPLVAMFDDLVQTFAAICRPADRLFLLPVYYAGGTAERQMDSDRLAAELKARGVAAEWVGDYAALTTRILGHAGPGDVVLSMGARDPQLPVFARELMGTL